MPIKTTLPQHLPSRSAACDSNEVEVRSANAEQGWDIAPGGAACEVRQGRGMGNANGNRIPLQLCFL